MIVVATIGMLAAMAIPNLIRARHHSQTNVCIGNLREIDSAKQQWALEKGSTADTTPGEAEIQPYIGRGVSGSLGCVKCPLQYVAAGFAGYSINSMKELPTCLKKDDTIHPATLDL